MFTKTNISSVILVSILATIASQNNFCQSNDKTNGTCIPLPNCKSALKLLKINPEQLKHLNCGFQDKTPKVCCSENAVDNVVFESSESTSHPTTQPPMAKVPRTTPLIRTTTYTLPVIDSAHRFPTHPPLPPQNTQTVPILPPQNAQRVPAEPTPVFSQVEVIELTTPPTLVVRGFGLPNRSVCGQSINLSDKIFGGTLAAIGEFPWTAMLKRDKSYGCVGTLINRDFIITAAHCVELSVWGEVTEVRLGEWDQETTRDCDDEICSDPVVDVPVGQIFIHPNYTRLSDRIDNDIALIKLKHSVNFTDFVRPICLPTTDYIAKRDYLSGIQYTAAGWGKTEFAASSVILKKVYLNSVSTTVCRASIKAVTDENVNNVICAGGVQGEDTCNGDSGSGLIKMETEENKRSWFLFGITSFGSPKCGAEGIPGVYTRVTTYMPWILNTISHNKSQH